MWMKNGRFSGMKGALIFGFGFVAACLAAVAGTALVGTAVAAQLSTDNSSVGLGSPAFYYADERHHGGGEGDTTLGLAIDPTPDPLITRPPVSDGGGTTAPLAVPDAGSSVTLAALAAGTVILFRRRATFVA
jgi:hypothetical protein